MNQTKEQIDAGTAPVARIEMIDVNNQEHLKLVLWACELFAYDAQHGTSNVKYVLSAAEIGPDLARRPIMSDPRMADEVETLRVLSSPSLSASLVRDLLARAGVTVFCAE